MRQSPTRLAFVVGCFLLMAAAPTPAQPDTIQYEPGVDVRVFDVRSEVSTIPDLVEGQTPNVNTLQPTIDLTDFGVSDHFYTEVRGWLLAPVTGNYTLRLTTDDGAIVYLDGKLVFKEDGPREGKPLDQEILLDARHHELFIRHFEIAGKQRLKLEWKKPGDEAFEVVPSTALSTQAGVVRVTAPGAKRLVGDYGLLPAPGDVEPLDAVHPAYELATIRPDGFKPKVGGMDLLSDGRLVISCWEPDGGVYILDGVGGDPKNVTVKRIAAGLAEPLGLKVIPKGDAKAPERDRLFVLQKQELTELIDHDGDDVIDEYRTVCAAWPVSDNFHEFAFGLAYKDGELYGTLAIAINPGGASTKPQKPERGRAIAIDPDTGAHRYLAYGLRTPNGIGIGVDGEIFICDNQGDWLPSSKLLHLQEDAFYNSRAALPEGFEVRQETPPVLWLPQNEIGNSPSQPGIFPEGSPFAGQMLHGEVTHGGLKRDFIEKVDGQYQGAVFRFTQGLEAGINRFVFGPNGDLYVGGVGGPGNWSHKDRYFGLQRLRPSGRTAFEMLRVEARANGLLVTFTKPLGEKLGWNPSHYTVEQWRYVPTAEYGGPKVDEQRLTVKSASVSDDRTQVFLELDDMKAGHVVYLRLHREHIQGGDGEALWATEAWYTMNKLPETTGDVAASVPEGAVTSPNVTPLTDEETADGWRLAFDGFTTQGWRSYGGRAFPTRGWSIDDGTLYHRAGGKGGDITYDPVLGDFEFAFEWRVAPGANSGVFYRADEGAGEAWKSAGEYQILDDDRHVDGKNPLSAAGSLYALIAANELKQLAPVGEWNTARIVADGDHIEHWLNGRKIVAYQRGSEPFDALVAASKFKDTPTFAGTTQGRIVLQDHGDSVWYRNLRVREIE